MKVKKMRLNDVVHGHVQVKVPGRQNGGGSGEIC